MAFRIHDENWPALAARFGDGMTCPAVIVLVILIQILCRIVGLS